MAIRIYPNPTGHTAKYPIDITYRRGHHIIYWIISIGTSEVFIRFYFYNLTPNLPNTGKW